MVVNGSRPPAYFERVRAASSKRWEQLEGDPELAGPWRQLFKQVQSPSHVLSELLQNADDAGATCAELTLDEGVFTFTHDGDDFIAEHFESLCRFGYSNKRALHTIGFRGIGFKSTFSLGDQVLLRTPSLAVAFEASRFTEPKWFPQEGVTSGHTEIRVRLRNQRVLDELARSVATWAKSPFSLLFFRNIKVLRIPDAELRWSSLGRGPVPSSEWFKLAGSVHEYLVVRSGSEAFPSAALAEVRDERNVDVQDFSLPPCGVEIVLGAPEGRLHVVLPTGVATPLPFACNAPFIQDPSRQAIKTPSISPTNTWLLERVGRLVGTTMKAWLGDAARQLSDRARAYSLLPNVDREATSLEGQCAAIVEVACDDVLSDSKWILTADEQLVPAGAVISLPSRLLDVWSAPDAATACGCSGRAVLHPAVSTPARQALADWNAVKCLNNVDVAQALCRASAPKPESWQKLCTLWSYLRPRIEELKSDYWKAGDIHRLAIVPVVDRGYLLPSQAVVRLAKDARLSDSQWAYVTAGLQVVDPAWPQFLTNELKDGEAEQDGDRVNRATAAKRVLELCGMQGATSPEKLFAKTCERELALPSRTVSDYVVLAHTAARMSVRVPEAFRYVTRDRSVLPPAEVIYDIDGSVEALSPRKWCAKHLLHPEYETSEPSCTADEWQRWVQSPKSGLRMGVPLVRGKRETAGDAAVRKELVRMGWTGDLGSRHYCRLELYDSDFTTDHVDAFAGHGTRDGAWTRVLASVVSNRDWTNHLKVSGNAVPSDGRCSERTGT